MDPLWILFIGVVVVIGGILALRLNAFLALVIGALVVAALTPAKSLEQFALGKKMPPPEAQKFSRQSIVERVTSEFGSTAGKIGILIAMASIVGKCLLDSGAADRIVRSTLRFLGESRASLAFLSSGFLLGIPVFFDTVFLLMIPLGKAMFMRTGRNYLLYVLAIIAGATMTHSLVPPTPGPLFVATALNVDMGLMIVGGCVVGAFTTAAGYLYALWINRKMEIPLRETNPAVLAELEAVSRRDDSQLPPLWLSLLPIALPVVLISGNAFLNSALSAIPKGELAAWQSALLSVGKVVGDSNIALTISCAIGLATLAWQKKENLAKLSKGVQGALEDAGLIILITAAGGAFGGVLQQTGIGPRIQDLAAAYHISVLPLAFAVTALVRIAQGSATVAMITGVGMFAGVATPEALGFHPLYLALAIGCGSKPIPWMNDSGFWVVCKMSGMTEKETLKTHSIMATTMGFIGIVLTMILARIFPMV
jgi:GntP family gluconate:H+ symporter